jgi:hypothetical protein
MIRHNNTCNERTLLQSRKPLLCIHKFRNIRVGVLPDIPEFLHEEQFNIFFVATTRNFMSAPVL